ncbi:hypothetical protein EXN66_Car015346 [Channa argus]|uniref:Uncharacterized protein n=1 Tax=Channa argus TaxID=215402 RepID=A0A6G1QB77_CHAAH|nr:hypothetical protein EXN66_Car015346 [Channa argus]
MSEPGYCRASIGQSAWQVMTESSACYTHLCIHLLFYMLLGALQFKLCKGSQDESDKL